MRFYCFAGQLHHKRAAAHPSLCGRGNLAAQLPLWELRCETFCHILVFLDKVCQKGG